MKEEELDNLFAETNFDIELPNAGHEERFLKKLNNTEFNSKSSFGWKPWLSIAASIILMISIFMFANKKTKEPVKLANVSPEMAKTESVFMASLSKELKTLDSQDMPEYQELIVDALFEIKILEEDFNQLVIGLKENPDDELILSAMIINFQNRIDILKDTQETIEFLKNKNVNTI